MNLREELAMARLGKRLVKLAASGRRAGPGFLR